LTLFNKPSTLEIQFSNPIKDGYIRYGFACISQVIKMLSKEQMHYRAKQTVSVKETGTFMWNIKVTDPFTVHIKVLWRSRNDNYITAVQIMVRGWRLAGWGTMKLTQPPEKWELVKKNPKWSLENWFNCKISVPSIVGSVQVWTRKYQLFSRFSIGPLQSQEQNNEHHFTRVVGSPCTVVPRIQGQYVPRPTAVICNSG
jgi:hypothetical protein